MSGTDRYQVKADAGWTRIRPDGSAYAAHTDDVAEQAERWACEALAGVRADDTGLLSGDEGYDFTVARGRVVVKVDVVHAGWRPDGLPRRTGCGELVSLIVNPDAGKLVASDVLVLVCGPPFAWGGGIHTSRFLARATLRDHGYGPKLSLDARELWPIARLFRR